MDSILLFQNLLGAIVQYVYPSPALTMLIHKIGNTEYMGANMLPSYALLVELDSQGKVWVWFICKQSHRCLLLNLFESQS